MNRLVAGLLLFAMFLCWFYALHLHTAKISNIMKPGGNNVLRDTGSETRALD
jgi:hypothetical protein